ncbi:isoprenyl transferase [Hydrogenibacillus schlegelii]|uniref:Isoprenyl transferase n=1 Tax=Hydrogenibacillus schlegelii TaxID=1484 RepID=A0A132MGG5_HYDSH|nr:isoprenyl transferase [Hydrogenibacillus schlegelii]KWW96855.1 UDP pyrophosphate synthase [Hydrogenibacillus schlegelii]OAR04782.1 UDP pyrophosphate synthase [Hydrogenibacillus schlegelii]
MNGSRLPVPRHVAIIMDGNGRWARARGLPRVMGHREGMKTVREVALAAHGLGIEVLTLYAFSTENWKRPRDEVDFLMALPQEFLQTELENLIQNNVRVRVMGDPNPLPPHTRAAVEEAVRRTAANTGLILNFALNYGGRMDIARAARKLAESAVAGEIRPEAIDEAAVAAALSTAGLPDPDLLIRTSGEMRLSNFMLFELAYTELWFVDKLWPDFRREDLEAAVEAYRRRDRRFGGLG